MKPLIRQTIKTALFFKSYSLFCLIFNLITIFWGAWVRLSLSGDACGKSWPLCDQGVLPEGAGAWIEWLHRFSSGLALFFVLILWILSRSVYSKDQAPRLFSFVSFVLILIEAFIGAVLVLSGWVALNTQALRVLVLGVHSVNSFLLIASLTLSCKTSLYKKTESRLKEQLLVKKPLIYFVLCFPLLALTGNTASLAGQLFPSMSLSSALALDLLPLSHISLKIRPLHPLLACLFLIVLSRLAFSKKELRTPALAVFIVVLFGFAALLSLSPMGMKIGHLILAYTLGVFLVWSSIDEKIKENKNQENSGIV